MQEAVGIITLVLVTLLAIVFLMVLRRASAPAVPGATADPGRFRAPLFWLLVVIGIGVPPARSAFSAAAVMFRSMPPNTMP